MRLLYLGISGVLHPSASRYQHVRSGSPWSQGHHPYESVPWLAQTLEPWPDLRIILTSTQPWKHGLATVLGHLGPLAARVGGFTFEDLTTQPVHQVQTRSGAGQWSSFSSEDYWRMNKSDIVMAHVAWRRPSAWMAVDDENILWPQTLASHVCIVDGCKGLKNPVEQGRVLTCLQENFGPGGEP